MDEIREPWSQAHRQAGPAQAVIWTAELPKTRSGKIMRRLLRDIAEGRELGDVTTLADPNVVQDLADKEQDDTRRTTRGRTGISSR